MVCNDIPRDIPECEPPRTYVCTYVLCENRSSIQSLALMRSAMKARHHSLSWLLHVPSEDSLKKNLQFLVMVAIYVSLVGLSDYTVTTNSGTMVNLVQGNQT